MQTSKSKEEIREDVIMRIEKMCNVVGNLTTAQHHINNAGEQMFEAWRGWPREYQAGGDQIMSLKVLGSAVLGTIEDKLAQAVDQAAFLIARDVIAPVAQESTEPVVQLTGNAFMPPIRSIEEVERIWIADVVGDLFPLFMEALERELDRNRIEMQCPDYDNMLYVIDLSRWTFLTDDEDPNAWLEQTNWSRLND